MTLARATILAASKSSEEDRTEQNSPLFQAAERVRALLLRILVMTTASASTLASAFRDAMRDVYLPACFTKVTFSS